MAMMKKVLCLILAVMILGSVTAYTAFAVNIDNDLATISSPEGDGAADPGGDSAGGEGEGSQVEPVIPGPGEEGGDSPQGDVVPQEEGGDQTAEGGDTTSYGGYGTVYSNEYFDEEKAAQGEANIGKVAQDSTLFDISSDDGALRENTWSDIKLTTKTTGGTTNDFSSIKASSDKEDNSQWIFYVGLALIGLSLLGVAYFIVSTCVYRKRLNALKDREIKNTERRQKTSFDAREYSDISEYSNRVNRPHSYSTTPRYTSTERRRMRQDTAELNLPRRFVKNK